MKYKGRTMKPSRAKQLKKHKKRLDKWRKYNLIQPNAFLNSQEKQVL